MDEKSVFQKEKNQLLFCKNDDNINDSVITITEHRHVLPQQAENKQVPILFGLLPAISNFVGISTLLDSDLLWLSVLVGFLIAIVNAYALYRNEKKPVCWTRSALVFVEVVGIFCIGYNAIQCWHRQTPASLPEPFNHYTSQKKTWVGICLLSTTVFFSLVMIYLENCVTVKRDDDHRKGRNVIRAKRLITGGMVFIGTYPLMINFFLGLNNEMYTIWLMVIAVFVSLCSCTGQAFLISRHEQKEQSFEEKRNLIILEWCGKFFMSIEIILSLANTTFSTHGSSVDECLELLQSGWISKNAQVIGGILFTLSIIAFMIVTYKHFRPLYDMYYSKAATNIISESENNAQNISVRTS
jgi:hypothetical protein